jgi:hypothetical protein
MLHAFFARENKSSSAGGLADISALFECRVEEESSQRDHVSVARQDAEQNRFV